MKNLSSLCLLLSLLVLNTIQAQDTDRDPSQWLKELISDNGIAGVAAGIQIGDSISWNDAQGYSDLEKGLPFNIGTRTRIASIAKPMTALAIMQLVETGKLDLDTPIRKYIPEFIDMSTTPITTRHLLSHTSGIDGYKSGKEAESRNHFPNLTSAMKVFSDRKLKFEPGSDYLYSTYGYVVLGVIIERVSGDSYENYMQQNIWDRAGMINTGVESPTDKDLERSLLYHAKKNNAKLAKANDLSNRTPGGGFYSTLEDIIRFSQAILNHTLVGPETFNQMIQVSSDLSDGNLYGFGWFLYGLHPNEGEVIGHGGGQTGANTHLFINPASKIIAVVLANTSATGNSVTHFAVKLLHYANELVGPTKT